MTPYGDDFYGLCNGVKVTEEIVGLFCMRRFYHSASRLSFFDRHLKRSRSKGFDDFPDNAEVEPRRRMGASQIKSFLLVYGAVKTTINDQGVVWIYRKGH